MPTSVKKARRSPPKLTNAEQLNMLMNLLTNRNKLRLSSVSKGAYMYPQLMGSRKQQKQRRTHYNRYGNAMKQIRDVGRISTSRYSNWEKNKKQALRRMNPYNRPQFFLQERRHRNHNKIHAAARKPGTRKLSKKSTIRRQNAMPEEGFNGLVNYKNRYTI